MSRRLVDAEHPAYHASTYGVDGQPQCRRCLADLPLGRMEFCSANCIHEFRIRVSPGYARQVVFHRDRGVCAHCRLDCGLLDRIVAQLRHGAACAAHAKAHQSPADADTQIPDDDTCAAPIDEDGEAAALWLIESLGLGKRKRPCSLWQVDHRVPFSTGGADCGLGNLRTLCLTCHKVQTKALHRGLKSERDERG